MSVTGKLLAFGEIYERMDLIERGVNKYAIIHVPKEINAPVASFTDGADDLPMKDLVIDITPVQDLHGQSNPYPGGTVSNLIQDGTNTSNGYVDGYYLKNDGTTTSNADLYISEYFSISPNTVYSYSSTKKLNAPSVCFYDSSKTFISGVNFNNVTSKQVTTPANAAYARASQYKDVNDTVIQFELGNEATAIKPYSNICPITGWTGANVTRTGKNLLLIDATHIAKPSQWTTSWLDTSLYENGIKCSRKSSDGGWGGIWIELTAGTYTLSFDVDLSNATGSYYNAYLYPTDNTERVTVINGTSSTSTHITATITLAKDGLFVFRPCANSWISNATHEIYFTNIQLEFGSTATAFAPYSGNTYPITWETEAGTVYGGSLDVTTGLLTVDRASWTLNGTESWTLTTASSGRRFQLNVSNLTGMAGTGSADTVKSDKFIWTETANNTFGHIRLTLSILNICDNASKFASADDFKYWLTNNNTQVVAPLATPTTYQLTPLEIRTILGMNNIWADTGNINYLEYPADTKLYIDRRISELIAQIVNS